MWNKINRFIKDLLESSQVLYKLLQMVLFRAWFFPRLTWFTALLWPLSCLRYLRWKKHCCLQKLFSQRNKFKMPVPVIHIESIVADKDKRTALFIGLAQILKKNAFQPGVLMYNNHAAEDLQGRLVTKDDDHQVVGSAALSIVQKAQVPVLLSKEYTPDVCNKLTDHSVNIILSNHKKHETSQRDIKIIVADADLWFGNQCLLPAGPLERPLACLREADLILINVPYALGQGNIDGETNFNALYHDKVSFLKTHAPKCFIGFMQMVPQGFANLSNKIHLSPHAFERASASAISADLMQLFNLSSALKALGIHLKDSGTLGWGSSLFFIDEEDAIEYESTSPQNNLFVLESSMQLEKENGRDIVLDELYQKIGQVNA